jgi:phosphotriesterase-related protein
MDYIQAVKGKIQPEELGKTLMHEHCLFDQGTAYNTIPEKKELKEFFEEKITIENRGKIFFHMHNHRDNLCQVDEGLIIRELEYFKKAGGGTIVDVSPPGLGRNPEALLRISESVGINIVSTTGLYIEATHPERFKKMNKKELADFMISEIHDGMDGTGIKPGYIGEIGISDDYTERELIVLRASAIAQKETGYALTIHQPIFKTYALRILDIVEQEGADLERVVMAHCDPTLRDVDYHLDILARGAYVQFDQFGLEFPVTYGPYVKRWLPRDIERIRAIKHLVEKGFENKITVSMDLAFKSLYKTLGGVGHSYIFGDLYDYFIF